MTDVRVTTTASTGTLLNKRAIQSLESSLCGGLLRRGEDGYEKARRGWNGMIDKHPALIAHCTSVADIVASVDFARENELLLAVRGGGHNVAGTAVADGGLVIDLSPMKGIRVDLSTQTVRAEAGVTIG